MRDDSPIGARHTLVGSGVDVEVIVVTIEKRSRQLAGSPTAWLRGSFEASQHLESVHPVAMPDVAALVM